MRLPSVPRELPKYHHELHAHLTKVLQRLPTSTGTGTSVAFFGITDEERTAGVTPTFYNYPELDARRYGFSEANPDNSGALQQLVDVIEAHGGGEGILPAGQFTFSTGIVFTSDGIRLTGAGGDRGITGSKGTRLYYTGSGTAFKGDGAHSCGLNHMQIRNGGGNGLVGLHLFNASNWLCLNLCIRELNDDNLLLECDTSESTIYNIFVGGCAFKADGTAIGVRMVEGAGKAVNNNCFVNFDLGSNLVGIQQDTECNDNYFGPVELGGCDTGCVLRGRITLDAANIENCTLGVDMVSGASVSIEGSLHFGGNTTDVSNPDSRPIFASMQGGDAGSSIGFNARNTGMSFRGEPIPATGGFNLSTADGDPVIQRNDVDYLEFASQSLNSKKALALPQMTTTARNALSPADGWMIYNTTTGQPEVRKAGAWVALA